MNVSPLISLLSPRREIFFLTSSALLLGICVPWPARAQPAQPPATVSATRQESNDVRVHLLRSDFQAGPTEVRVLLPSSLDAQRRHRCLYVLPVEAARGSRYGDGLREIQRLGLHEKHRLICVGPTFSALPWYADHPSDSRVRQESYFLQDVVPLVDRTYPTRSEPAGRWLVGFSKSGWGAFSLLLRHPDVFGKAAAWDAPFAVDRPVSFGMGAIFATQENFEQYRITALVRRSAGRLGPEPRLIHLGYGNFREHHQSLERLLTELNVPHVYRDGPKREHTWSSGWLEEAVEALAVGAH